MAYKVLINNDSKQSMILITHEKPHFFKLYIIMSICIAVAFTQSVYIYTVSESVGSQGLALTICITVNTTKRSFNVSLTPVSGSAEGKISCTSSSHLACIGNYIIFINNYVMILLCKYQYMLLYLIKERKIILTK